jgi:hypothetical protein
VTSTAAGNPALRQLEKVPPEKRDGLISSCSLSVMLPAKGIQIQKDTVNGRKIGCNTVFPILSKIVINAYTLLYSISLRDASKKHSPDLDFEAYF